VRLVHIGRKPVRSMGTFADLAVEGEWHDDGPSPSRAPHRHPPPVRSPLIPKRDPGRPAAGRRRPVLVLVPGGTS
jgi:hypothetical protein